MDRDVGIYRAGAEGAVGEATGFQFTYIHYMRGT